MQYNAEFSQSTTYKQDCDWSLAAEAYPDLLELPSFVAQQRQQYESSELTTKSADPGLLQGRQLEAYTIVRDHLEAHSSFSQPLRMVVSGTAGTGKSYLIQCLKLLVRDHLLVAAPTGVTAFNVDGYTLHSDLSVTFALLISEFSKSKVSPKKKSPLEAIKDKSVFGVMDSSILVILVSILVILRVRWSQRKKKKKQMIKMKLLNLLWKLKELHGNSGYTAMQYSWWWQCHKEAFSSLLSLPIRGNFKPLEGKRLQTIQQTLSGVDYIIVDEMSMVGRKIFGQVDRRLRQVFPARSEEIFGGCSFLLFGDWGQLPPVMDLPLYTTVSRTELSDLGSANYHLFDRAVALDRVM